MAAVQGISYEAIVRDVRAGKIAPIYYLMGDEPYYIDMLSDFIADTLLKPEEKDFNLDVLYGLETNMAKIVDLARAYPMMAERRVVLVREAQSLRSLEGLEAYLQHLTPTTVLVFCHKKKETLARNKSVAKAIQKVGVMYESKKLWESQLPGFIASYFKRKGVAVEADAIRMLVAHVGSDLCRLASEMDKLAVSLPADDKTVTVAQVEEVTGMSREYNDFELVSALAARDIVRAQQIVKYYQGRTFALPLSLSNLFTFFSDVMMAFYSPDRSERGVAQWLGKNEWQVRRDIMPALGNYKGMKVMQILDEIRKTDAAGKGVDGCRTSPDELLQELVFFILH